MLFAAWYIPTAPLSPTGVGRQDREGREGLIPARPRGVSKNRNETARETTREGEDRRQPGDLICTDPPVWSGNSG